MRYIAYLLDLILFLCVQQMLFSYLVSMINYLIFLYPPPRRGGVKNQNSNFCILPPWGRVYKNWGNLKIVEHKLQNMNFKTHRNKIKSKRWALYLKIWASYGNFCESRLDEISISQNFEILKSRSIFKIFAQFFAWELNF